MEGATSESRTWELRAPSETERVAWCRVFLDVTLGCAASDDLGRPTNTSLNGGGSDDEAEEQEGESAALEARGRGQGKGRGRERWRFWT